MDYSQYTVQPQFSTGQANKVRKIKAFLGNEHSHSSKERMRKKLADLYKSRSKARAGYEAPAYGKGSMSNSQVDSQVVSAVRSKYGNEIDASPARQAQISKYYDDYNTELANIRTQQAQAQQAQIDAINSAQQTTSKNEQSANESLLSSMQSDAASRGATVDPSLFVKANQASANRAGLNNIQTAQMGATKNANDAYYASQGLINRGQKQSALDKERSYTTRLRGEAADYAKQTRQQLDQSSFDRGLATATLGEKISARKAGDAMDAARLAVSQQNADANTLRSQNSGKGGSKKGRYTQTQLDGFSREWNNMGTIAKKYYPGYKGRADDLATTLQNGYDDGKGNKVKGQTKDSKLALAYALYYRYGGVTKSLSHYLALRGIHIPVSKFVQDQYHSKK